MPATESEMESKASNRNLSAARAARNDEFYTQYADIQKEVNAYIEFNPDVFRGKTVLLPCDDPEWSNFTKFFAQNFEAFGLKKLISTSYAVEAKNAVLAAAAETAAKKKRGRARTPAAPTAPGLLYQPTLFETEAPHYDAAKTRCRGKIFVLDHDTNANGRIDIEDLEWKYLEGDGDFRSAEVRALRDEADIIVTNPPFSLFREFLAWIVEADKKFLVIGNKNAIKYKDVFGFVKDNEIWSGRTEWAGGMWFKSANGEYDKIVNGEKLSNVASVWYTNLDHGRRHQPLMLMTAADNKKYSKHKDVKGVGYKTYANYDAIEIPHVDSIPSDYDGVMGVPITFFDKYCPEQFEILGSSPQLAKPIADFVEKDAVYEKGGPACYIKIGPKTYKRLYDRILIRHRRPVSKKSC